MFASQATMDVRAISVLLGGSGRAREPVIRQAVLPALLMPRPPVSPPAERAFESIAAAA